MMNRAGAAIASVLVLVAAPVAAAQGFAANRLYAASVGEDAVFEFDGSGGVLCTLGEGVLQDPRGLAFGPDGLLYVTSGDEILAFDAEGQLAATIGPGTALSSPRGLVFGPDGNLYATSGDRVLAFDSSGAEVREIGADLPIGVPVGIAFSAGGDLYVASGGANTILRFDASGVLVDEIGSGSSLSVPMGMAFGPGGVLHVASFFSHEILAFDAAGQEVPALTISDPDLLFPMGLAFGPNGHLFASAFFNAKVIEFDEAGAKVQEIAAPGGFENPEGLAFSPLRLRARLKGKVRQRGAGTAKIAERATLFLAPGSGTMMLALNDDPGNGQDLASAFGSTSIVFHGFEAYLDLAAEERRFQGAQVGAPLLAAGLASLTLKVEGKLAAFGDGTAFKPKKARGTIHRAASGSVYKGRVKTHEILD
ncbi:MAG: NHL repeat-containing protein [Planctomycetes bacterium]|nr:NHL repeat-containing protein [Planctomycetota bacterium]